MILNLIWGFMYMKKKIYHWERFHLGSWPYPGNQSIACQVRRYSSKPCGIAYMPDVYNSVKLVS